MSKEQQKPTDEEVFLSNLKDHPYADSFKGTIEALEKMIEREEQK